jgi:hypothetical protein
MNSPIRFRFLFPIVAAFLTLPVFGQLIVTYAEDPWDVNSQLSGTSVYDFNSLAVVSGSQTEYTNVVWDGVGTFDRLLVHKADRYGGAVDEENPNGSNYAVQGLGTAGSTTLTFTTPNAYFGLWWSAGDASNILSFYDENGVLVAQFSTDTLLNKIAGDASYKGNPRTETRSENRGESYAFINFFGVEGTTWSTVVLSNGANSGFEADNYTTRETAWSLEEDGPLPGYVLAVVDGTVVTPVPETSSLLLAAAALPLVLRRRRAAI